MANNQGYRMFDDYPDILSVGQLQSALGIGRSTAYKLVQSGTIMSFHIGTSVKIPKSEVISYIQTMCYTNGSSGQANSGCQKGEYVS